MSGRYLVRRAVQALLTAAAIVLIGFLLIHLAPGDPVLALAGEHGDAAYFALMRERFGLDRPLPERLATYFGRLVRGDFGLSYIHGRPAMAVIAERLPPTLLLAGTSLVLSTVLGLLAGVAAGTRHRRWPDAVVSVGALTLYASPVFWLGQLAILGLAFGLGVFPIQGMVTPGSEATGPERWLDVARHLALPALVLASQQLAAIARLTREALIDEMASDHVRTARAKGLPPWRVTLVHALPRALLPVVTVLGSRLGFLVSGAVLVEIVFGWPGIGRLLVDAVQTRDSPVLLGIFTLVAFGVLLGNLLADLAYARLDPRVRYG